MLTLLKKGVVDTYPELRPVDIIYRLIKQAQNSAEKAIFIQAETGSGKSTLLTSFLFKQFGFNVVSVQPRVSNCQNIRDQIMHHDRSFVEGINIGIQSGDEYVPLKSTGVFLTTFGAFSKSVLLVENPHEKLKMYDIVIIDEVHEMDLLSINFHKYIKNYIVSKKNLSESPIFIFTSATFDMPRFAEYYGSSLTLFVPGRSFPVTDHYLKYDSQDIYADALKIIKSEKSDVLVFFASREEIKHMTLVLAKAGVKAAVLVFTRETRHDPRLKQSAKELGVPFRIILATNIAETGITITGLKRVIDTGYHNPVSYNPDLDVHVTSKVPISKTSAHQRRGRVGRAEPGDYYALFSRQTYEMLEVETPNKIYVSDITESVYRMLHSGIDIFDTDLIYVPNRWSLHRSVEKLLMLGLITEKIELTSMGEAYQSFAYIEVEQFRIIMAAYQYKVHPIDVIYVAAALRAGSFDYRKNSFYFETDNDDFIPMIQEIYNIETSKLRPAVLEYVLDVRSHAIIALADVGLDPYAYEEESFFNHTEAYITKLKKCIYEGLRMHLATWEAGRYKTRVGLTLDNPFHCSVNSFVYWRVEIKNGKHDIVGKCILDNHVNYTTDF